MLAASEFEVLARKQAFISNIARGPIIQQTDLITALSQGLVQGAALDVTDPEPLPEDSPLWDMPNVTITPHVSGRGTAYIARAFDILDINLTRLQEHKKLLNVVDRSRGY